MTDIHTHHLNLEGVIAFIKKHRRNRQCFIRVSIFGYTQLPDENGDARGFDMTGLVPVGARLAIKTVTNVAEHYAKNRDIKIQVGISDRCIFIG